MKIYHLFIAFVILCYFSACIKTGDKQYTISGHVYERCGEPAANQSFLFYQGSGRGAEDAGWTTTDANGAFSITYKQNNGIELQVGQQAGYGYSNYVNMFSNKNYNGIKIYKQPSCYIKVSMQVYNNSYTNQDTLYVGDLRPGTPSPYLLKVAGPFTSGTLYTIPKFNLANGRDEKYTIVWGYKINNKEYLQRDLQSIACDTVNAVAEIR